MTLGIVFLNDIPDLLSSIGASMIFFCVFLRFYKNYKDQKKKDEEAAKKKKEEEERIR